MRRGFTIIELVVVIAIIATLAGLLVPVVAAARGSQGPIEKSPPPVSWYFSTIQHDGHWWVTDSARNHFEHHPDCPCYSRRAEESLK